VEAEILEARMCNGEKYDLSEHAHISSTLLRIAARIGLRRRLKEVPNLADYLAAAGFQHHDDAPLRATLDPDRAEDIAASHEEFIHAKEEANTIDAVPTDTRVVPIRRAIDSPSKSCGDQDDAPRDGGDE
jgi:hypothetical protein